MSASTVPASTLASCPGSPTSTRRVVSGRARSSCAMSGSETIDASSTITMSASIGMAARRRGPRPSRRCNVVGSTSGNSCVAAPASQSSFRTASPMRAAALPVGAASATDSGCAGPSPEQRHDPRQGTSLPGARPAGDDREGSAQHGDGSVALEVGPLPTCPEEGLSRERLPRERPRRAGRTRRPGGRSQSSSRRRRGRLGASAHRPRSARRATCGRGRAVRWRTRADAGRRRGRRAVRRSRSPRARRPRRRDQAMPERPARRPRPLRPPPSRRLVRARRTRGRGGVLGLRARRRGAPPDRPQARAGRARQRDGCRSVRAPRR